MEKQYNDTKHLKRTIRVLRLLAAVQAYHCYTMMELCRKSMQYDNSWEDAEHMSDLMNLLLPCNECSPTDFLHDTNEMTDTILNYHDEYKKWIKLAEKMGISEKTLTAFCKNVENMQSVFRLKIIGHVYYPEWLMSLFFYLNHAISKAELQDSFVEFSLFSGKPKPAKLSTFLKTILEIEEIISEIAYKQTCRSIPKN